jgi:hypothetical protein
MESVTKRPNHYQCFTRDEGKKKQRDADTSQWLTKRAINANGCQWVRSFFSHCAQQSDSPLPDSNPAKLRGLCIFIRREGIKSNRFMKVGSDATAAWKGCFLQGDTAV